MKKLIFLRDGAINRLCLELAPYNIDIDIECLGYKKALKFFQHIENGWFASTCPTILHSIDWWNEEEQRFEIYIPTKKGKLKNIQEFTDRELRRAHNIEKMFLAGVFDD